MPSPDTVRLGSSPRIRGELPFGGVEKCVSGIIPANTGRIHPLLDICRVVGDHPREYGENILRLVRFEHGWGSSPRIRGELGTMRGGSIPGGIIPANTGRMWAGCRWGTSGRDHPREYGENPPRPWCSPPPVGSSPRIRGESLFSFHTACLVGIIPANTGRILADLRKPDQQD